MTSPFQGRASEQKRDGRREREQRSEAVKQPVVRPYQIHENVGCHFFILLILLRDRWGDSDATVAAQ